MYTQCVISRKQEQVFIQHGSCEVFLLHLFLCQLLSAFVTVLFMQGNASDVCAFVCVCVCVGLRGMRCLLCWAQPSFWAKTQDWDRGGMEGHGTRQWGANLEPCFWESELLWWSHISFGEMKRVPSLPLSSWALCVASQFPKEAEWQLSLGSAGSRASNSLAEGVSVTSHHCSHRLLWCDVSQTSVPLWHYICEGK